MLLLVRSGGSGLLGLKGLGDVVVGGRHCRILVLFLECGIDISICVGSVIFPRFEEPTHALYTCEKHDRRQKGFK